jgi:acylphosphatase
MGEAVAKRIHVYGHVQGVWFRDWTVERAGALGLDGWVRNRADGHVEMVVRGPAGAVEAMISACREGSPASRVDRVSVEDSPGIIAPGFSRKPTV